MGKGISASNVAKYLLALQDDDAGDLISNMKLQKLLYYSQGCYLAVNGAPLFNEPIFAWTHGPVVPTVYHEYKHHAGNGIPLPAGFDDSVLPLEAKEFLREVYRIFGQFSAWKLRNMTHDEPPYLEAKDDNSQISLKSMASYFSEIVEK